MQSVWKAKGSLASCPLQPLVSAAQIWMKNSRRWVLPGPSSSHHLRCASSTAMRVAVSQSPWVLSPTMMTLHRAFPWAALPEAYIWHSKYSPDSQSRLAAKPGFSPLPIHGPGMAPWPQPVASPQGEPCPQANELLAQRPLPGHSLRPKGHPPRRATPAPQGTSRAWTAKTASSEWG